MDAAGKRELGFMPGGPIPESFFEPLREDELARWEGIRPESKLLSPKPQGDE
ncbi:MAG TPA: hypothetical protein VGM84_05065 [Steroidobacteraceae bacterium]|jgi:hypothetical protein